MTPLLSIHCLTYNHAPFIRQTLDGFVMQKTNFPFEVLIHDDASTDGTADIIREYEAKYPDIIKPIYQTENQWNKGVSISKKYQFPRIKGKYVALCEGDDYWTDPLKLQKQVDFLESHPDCSICFHPVVVHWEDKSKPDSIYPTEKQLKGIKEFDLHELLNQNFIQTNSVVYRWRFHQDNLDLIPEKILPGDWFLHLLHAQVGKIVFLPEVMATYRRHQGGIWTGAGQEDGWFIKCGIPHIKFYKAVEKQFNVNKQSEIENMFVDILAAAINQKNNVFFQDVIDNNKNIWNKISASKFCSFQKWLFLIISKIPFLPQKKKIKHKLKQVSKIVMIKNNMKTLSEVPDK